MLEIVKTCVNKKRRKTFDQLFVDYMLEIQDQSISFELEFLKRNNKLDVMKLDKLIDLSFKEAIDL